ncbi:MAG: hypothetical protein K5656_12480 [Lachnospiraceae bacterium]|nr:hypothetical protein [Lachnospiraceae bacterium]
MVQLVAANGIYPSGSDTMYHVYRGQYVYESVKSGDLYPLLNQYWYNGVELMRYWPPFTAYLMAFFDFIASGDVFNGYLFYIGFIFIGGAISWAFVGYKLKRPVLGCFLGILWFFIPNNLYALFGEGNLPRALSMVFLPLLFFCIYNYYLNENVSNLVGIIVFTFLIVMCHLGYAGMVILALAVYMIIYCIINEHSIIKSIRILISILLGFALTGLYAIPSLHGGMTSGDNANKLQLFFAPLKTTLNPLYRITDNIATFYFGLAVLILIIIGIIGSHKEQEAGFINAIIILLLTSSSAYYLVKMLPGSGFLWMIRFISIAICFALMSFIYWKSLKRSVVILLCGLLLIDSVPSAYFIYGDKTNLSPNERLEQKSDDAMITEAKKITKQRLALMDLSSLGADGAYLTAEFNGKTKSMFGAGWEASVTSYNITEVNYSLEEGYYLYMFDRLKELGNDTVILKKSAIPLKFSEEIDYNILMDAATRNGYSLYDSNGSYYLFNLPVESDSWGTVVEYKGIAIGSSANTSALNYPNIKETNDTNINHYSYEELKKYEFVLLSGFTYDNKEAAEELVKKVSDKGVRFVIVGDTIPEDKKERIQSFLGVSSQVISFSYGYPLLYAEGMGWMDCDLFPQEYKNWQAHYLNGLDEVKGYFKDNDIKLDFYGTVYNDNISFVGLGLPYYLSLTQDDSINKFMGEVLKISSSELPKREIVPIKLEHKKNKIIINSDKDNVNTSLAFHDIFKGEGIVNDNNLLTVNKGETVVSYSYPYFVSGLLVSLFGLIFSILYIILCRRLKK